MPNSSSIEAWWVLRCGAGARHDAAREPGAGEIRGAVVCTKAILEQFLMLSLATAMKEAQRVAEEWRAVGATAGEDPRVGGM